jgi:hypothetical protein
MKKTVFLLSIFAVLFVSCNSIDLATYEDENLYAELETKDPAMVTLLVANRGDREYELDRERLSYTRNGQTLQMSPLVLSQTGTAAPP